MTSRGAVIKVERRDPEMIPPGCSKLRHSACHPARLRSGAGSARCEVRGRSRRFPVRVPPWQWLRGDAGCPAMASALFHWAMASSIFSMP